ncbi:hypothetical protein [Nocardiopsis metallicus]|uniref:Uncharacterized protein n=1 Tax=Nocardiopsis metallicus TaxID=179819 RepID=A0A840WH24_9ACTN|nr:hypothetical protein [Nocardiopsis metallicus]MBB5490726.1 hypothetical protein [Nocardiopsis metallicus]
MARARGHGFTAGAFPYFFLKLLGEHEDDLVFRQGVRKADPGAAAAGVQGDKGPHAGPDVFRCFFGERAKGRSGNSATVEDQRVDIVDLIDVERENPRIPELAENDF